MVHIQKACKRNYVHQPDWTIIECSVRAEATDTHRRRREQG